jgi:hypothetical protein
MWRQEENLTFREIGLRLGVSIKGASKAFLKAGERFRVAYENLAGPHSSDSSEGEP